MDNTFEKELSYEKAYSRLEEIVEKMSSAEVPLEELVKLYEEGMTLSVYCEKLLKSYEARLEKFSQRTVFSEADEMSGDE